MTDFYTEAQRRLQAESDSTALADALAATIVTDEIGDDHREFIESRDFFFLSTVNADGEPTVSYKGGGRGVVTVLDERTLLFPSYDGNGMFLSMGNIAETAKIGMLFIDFETPHRVRVQAKASLSRDSADLERYPGATLVVRAQIDAAFVNCGRYIHKHERVESSPYVPNAAGEAPVPAWKRIDLMQDVLPEADRARIEHEGGTIDYDEYAERVADGRP